MGDKPFESLNMVPFIDIMLVLLTIVLTTSSFIANGRLVVNLPKASSSANTPPPAQTLVLLADGRLQHQGQALELAALSTRLAGMDRNTPWLLQADRTLALERFVEVLDTFKQLGFAHVALQTEVGRR